MPRKATTKRSKSAGRYPRKKITKTAASTRLKAPRKYGVLAPRSGYQQPVTRYTTANNKQDNKYYQNEFDSMEDCSKDLILSILDPEMSLNPQRWPNTYGVSALFKTKDVLDAHFTANKTENAGQAGEQWSIDNTHRSLVVVYPQMSQAIYTTQSSKKPVDITLDPLTHVGASDNNFNSRQTFSMGIDEVQEWTQPFYMPGKRALFPFPNSTTGKMLYSAGYTTVATTLDNLQLSWVSGAFRGIALIRMVFYDINFAAIGTREFFSGNGGNTTLFQTAAFNPSDNAVIGFYYFSIRVETQGSAGIDGEMRLMISGSNTANVGIKTLRVYPTAEFCDYKDINSALAVSNSSDESFVVAQSLLCTFEGSSLTNAGQLAIARIPPRSELGSNNSIDSKPWDNLYSYLASLPVHNYNGPVKNGGYAWYLSTDEQGYFYQRANKHNNTKDSYLVAEFTTNDSSNTAIRVMVNTIVQFCTISNAFQQQPSDYIGSDIERIRHLLSNIPAAYENFSHRDQLTRKLSSLGQKVWSLAKNPNTYKAIGEGIKAAQMAGEMIAAMV